MSEGKHVIIIYNASDNTIEGKQKGWVENFKQLLQMILYHLTDRAPNFTLVSENAPLEYKALEGYDIMIAILSPAFIKNRKRHQVFSLFKEIKEKQDIPIEHCLFKVSKVLTEVADQPVPIKSLSDYPLFAIDQDNGGVVEYSNFLEEETEDFFWMKMVDLAYDINHVLNNDGQSTNIRSIYTKKTIFLASVSHDLQIQRNILRKELLRYGHTILPEQHTFRNLDEFRSSTEADIQRSDLSIHLIGSQYGEVIFEGHQSSIELQHKSASGKCKQIDRDTSGFLQLVWLKPESRNLNEQQKGFIERIKRDADTSAYTEVLQNTLEDFKNVIRNELFDWAEEEEEKAQHVEQKTFNGQPLVYFIYDKVDHSMAQPLIGAILKLGYNVLLPVFKGDIFSLRKQHVQNLKNFDYAFVYQHNVNDQWVEVKLLDLLKCPGFGRNKAILGKMFLQSNSLVSVLKPHLLRGLNVEQGDKESLLDAIKGFLENPDPQHL